MAYQSEIEKLKRRYDEKPEQWFAALADAHRKVGDLDRAIRIVQAGIQQRPNYVSGHIVLGRCLVDQGADDEAEKVFEEVLELDAENIIALKVLGDVSERRGNREAARRWLGRLLEVDPMNDEARMMLDRVSQPEEAGESPDSSADSIITESAARAAGVASKGVSESAPDIDDESDTAPIVEPVIETPAAKAEVQPTPVRDAPMSLLRDESEEDDESAELESSLFDDLLEAPSTSSEPAESEFVIERTSEALEVVSDDAPDAPNPFAAIEEAETRMLSFDGAAESEEPSDRRSLSPDDSGELAAGTLDFTPTGSSEARESAEEAESASLDESRGVEEGEALLAGLASDARPLFESPAFHPESEIEDPDQSGLKGDDESAEPWSSPRQIDEAPEPTGVAPLDESNDDAESVRSELDRLFLGTEESSEAPAEGLDQSVSEEPYPVADSPDQQTEDASDDVPVIIEDEPEVVASAPSDESGAAVLQNEGPTDEVPVVVQHEDEPSSVMTETMAEVYASQGLFDQARDVYRQLLERAPGDSALEARLAALNERAGAGRGSREDGERKTYSAIETGGISVRSMLLTMLNERPGSGPSSADDVVFVTPSEPSPLEQAFGDSSVTGEPTHPAPDEPSLASLFGDDETEPDESAVLDDADSQDGVRDGSLTYDGFYGSDPAPNTDEPVEAEDDEEFKAWLRSLRS